MMPFFSLGPLLIQAPPLVWLAGVWLASARAEKNASALGLSTTVIQNLIFYSLVAGLAAARLAYAVRFAESYLADPLSLLALTPATLDPLAGVGVALITAWAYGQKQGLTPGPTLAALAPSPAVMLVAAPLANLLSGEAYGMPTALPWGIELWGERRHPVQAYEALTALGIAVWAWRAVPRPDGRVFWQVVMFSAWARALWEGFRATSTVWVDGWRAEQLLALGVAGLAWWLAHRQPPAGNHARLA